MRHRKKTAKLGRTSEHRNMMLANLVCSLIKHRRVKTTLAKAKAARSVAEKMLTLGKHGTIHDRRLAAARLHQEDAVRILFNEIAPTQKDRPGGYTRIIRLQERRGDAAQLAILEWVDDTLVETADKDTSDAARTKAPEEKAKSETKTAPAVAAPQDEEPAEEPKKPESAATTETEPKAQAESEGQGEGESKADSGEESESEPKK